MVHFAGINRGVVEGDSIARGLLDSPVMSFDGLQSSIWRTIVVLLLLLLRWSRHFDDIIILTVGILVISTV